MDVYEANKIFEHNEKFINFDSNYLLITSKGGDEIEDEEEFSKKFSKKLDTYNQDKLSDRTYIGLTYPPTEESDNTFRLFFDSIRCGLTRNIFYGTVFISLSMYDSFDRFIENGYAKDFYNLIDRNKNNAVFIIQVYSSFEGKEKLIEWLNLCKNTYALENIFSMAMVLWESVVFGKIDKKKISLSPEEKEVVSLVIEKLVKSENFETVDSINSFVNKINFFKEMNGELLTEDNVCSFLPKEKSEKIKIGFVGH